MPPPAAPHFFEHADIENAVQNFFIDKMIHDDKDMTLFVPGRYKLPRLSISRYSINIPDAANIGDAHRRRDKLYMNAVSQ